MAIDKRINFRFGGAYQGGSGAPGSAEASSKGTSSGTGGSSGNLGGGGGGQNSDYRRYEAPTKPTYDSTNIDQKPITGADFQRSQNEFINNLNQNNFLRAQQTNTPFQPYQGGAFAIDKMKQSSPVSGIMRLLAGLAIPGSSFLMNSKGMLSDGIMALNNKIQNTDLAQSRNLMDYLNIKRLGGYEEMEKKRAATMQSAKDLQADIDSGLYDGTREVRPVQTFTFDKIGETLNRDMSYYNDVPSNLVSEVVSNSDVAPEFQDLAIQAGGTVGNYSQNAVSQQLYGKDYRVLDPFTQQQIDKLIEDVGTKSTGELASGTDV